MARETFKSSKEKICCANNSLNIKVSEDGATVADFEFQKPVKRKNKLNNEIFSFFKRIITSDNSGLYSCNTNPNYNVTGVILEKDLDKEFLKLIMIESLGLWNP